MSFKDKFLTMYRSDKVYLAEWLLAIVTGVFVFVTSSTWDLQSLTQWSVNVWHSIANGDIRSLYAYTAGNVYKVHHAHMGSELFSVLPWSVWNLPLFFIQRATGAKIGGSALMLAYSKLFLVLVSVVVLIYTKKITMIVTGDKAKSVWAMYLTASSVYLYLTVCYSGQNDILMICASVIGIYCMLRGKHAAFIAWSVLAIAIKPFFLLPFLAVLVLTEKKVLYILADTFIGVSGLVAQKLFFRGAPGYYESMHSGPADDMLKEMFPANINTAYGGISFFAIALVLIFIYSYSRDFDRDAYLTDTQNAARHAVYIVALTYVCYVSLSPFSFYRAGVMLPFLYIVLVQNTEMGFYNMVIDIAMQGAFVIKMILRGSIMFNVMFVNNSLTARVLGYKVDEKKAGYAANLDRFLGHKVGLMESFQPLFAGVTIVCAGMLMALNRPDKQVKLKYYGYRHYRVLVWARTLIIVPFALLIVYLFTKANGRYYV